MLFSKKMYIGGELVDGQATTVVVNPATEKQVGVVASAGLTDVDKALKAAEAAFPSWSQTSINERAAWMLKLRDAVIENEEHLRDCIHHEMGKDWGNTQEDFDSLVNSLKFYAEEISRVRPEMIVDRDGTHTHTVYHEPLGVAVAFLAWNFPLLNLSFKLAPAMAAGCPIIIRPSSQSPISAYAVGELCAKIGMPAGVINIIATETFAGADALSSSTIPALLTLIGSTSTGRHIMKVGSTSIKRYSMELGGNAPVLVFADADLDLAADIICAVKFTNAGQVCVSPNRVFVDASVADEFAKKVTERANAVKVGFDKNADIDMGPVIDMRAWNRLDQLVKDAVAQGATILAGGGRPKGLEKGAFFAPTVISGASDDMKLSCDESFGPIVSLLSFEDEEDLLRRANNTDGGLTAYVFTNNADKMERCSKALRFGEIQINGVKYAIDLPHGGMGQAGIGHDCSHLALNDYLTLKRVTRAIKV